MWSGKLASPVSLSSLLENPGSVTVIFHDKIIFTFKSEFTSRGFKKFQQKVLPPVGIEPTTINVSKVECLSKQESLPA